MWKYMSYIFISAGCHLFLFNGQEVARLGVRKNTWSSCGCFFFFLIEFAKVAESAPRNGHWDSQCSITSCFFLCLFKQAQFSHSVVLTLCDPMDCSRPGFPVHHQLLELAQTHVHQVSHTIQPSHPLSSPSPPAFNLSQHQSLFQWVSSLHQVTKVLEFQLQHQSFPWIFRNDFL